MGWPHCRLKPAQLPCMIGVDEGQAGAGSPTKPTTAGNREMHGSGRSGKSGSRSAARELRRGLADFVLALALFWGVVLAVGGSDNRAHAISLPTIAKETILDAGASGLAGLRAAEFAPCRPQFQPNRRPAVSRRSCCSASRLPPLSPAIWRFGVICAASMPPRGVVCGGGFDRDRAVPLPQSPPPHFHQFALYDRLKREHSGGELWPAARQ